MIGEGRPLLREKLANIDLPLPRRRFSIYFRSQRLSVTASETKFK